jgi:CheY-like chemotaxis protein
MSGLDLQRELRAKGLSIPAIFATAEDDASGQLQTKLFQAGATAVLRKPFNPEELVRLVRSALDTRRLP